jgi:hypothetical protein
VAGAVAGGGAGNNLDLPGSEVQEVTDLKERFPVRPEPWPPSSPTGTPPSPAMPSFTRQRVAVPDGDGRLPVDEMADRNGTL